MSITTANCGQLEHATGRRTFSEASSTFKHTTEYMRKLARLEREMAWRMKNMVNAYLATTTDLHVHGGARRAPRASRATAPCAPHMSERHLINPMQL
jgi:hypothetical protein